MSVYLLDFENVHDSGLNGVTNLTEGDEIYIFYSVKSEHMSFDTHVSIMKSDAKVKYIKLRRSAKNYLDFQLVTHLGYMIGSGQAGPYFIISKDTGYDSVVDYWKDHGVTILRQPSIGYNLTQRKATGQSQVHYTPPAIVMVKEGNTITDFTVPVIQLPSDIIPSDDASEMIADQSAGNSGTKENESNSIMSPPEAEDAVKEAPVDTEALPFDDIPAEEIKTPQEKKSRSRNRRGNSRKKTADDPAASAVNAAAPASGSAAQDVSAEQVNQTETVSDAGQTDKEDSVNKTDKAEKEAKAGQTNPANPEKDNAPKEIKITPQTLPESYRKKVRTALKGKNLPSAYYSSIYKAIINSYDKLALNNLLVKTFGSSRGGEIYNLIRDIFTDYQSVLG